MIMKSRQIKAKDYYMNKRQWTAVAMAFQVEGAAIKNKLIENAQHCQDLKESRKLTRTLTSSTVETVNMGINFSADKTDESQDSKTGRKQSDLSLRLDSSPRQRT